MKGRPLPFDEKDFDVFWKKEPWDELVPQGFLSDFVLSTRGIETPTNFCLWSGLFLVSSALKRDSWLKWYPSIFVPNLFVILVGPPRILAKSTSVNYGEGKILSKFHEMYEDERMRRLKRVNIVRKSTPEALSLALAPDIEVWFDKTTMMRNEVDRGSQVCLIVSELAMFLGKQKYNVGLIDRLTHLYDCMEIDGELTITRGPLEFRNVFATLFGATTPDGLANSIPQEAFGSGFMSRLIIINGEVPTRSFPVPRPVYKRGMIAVDWPQELQRRLAWLAEKSIGEFTLAPETMELVSNWYHGFKKNLTRKFNNMDHDTLMRSRYDTHLFKLMVLLRAQSYEHPADHPLVRIIQPGDFYAARALLDQTFRENFRGIEDAVVHNPEEKWGRQVLRILKANGGEQTKAWLFPRMSPGGCRAPNFRAVLHQLSEEGKVEIISADGKVQSYATPDGRERYRLTGKEIKIDGLSESNIESYTSEDEESLSGDRLTPPSLEDFEGQYTDFEPRAEKDGSGSASREEAGQ